MKVTFDCEVYRNYFSLCVKDIDTGEYFLWEKYNDVETGLEPDLLEDMLSRATFIGFNSMKYDNFIMSAYLCGFSNAEMKQLSTDVISNRSPLLPWQGWNDYAERGLVRYSAKQEIDIFNIPKGFHSLKSYAGRIGFPKLQELPVHWDKTLTDEDVAIIRPYNRNDCDVTQAIYMDQRPQVLLRSALSKKYRIDLLSKSDAQIAEGVIKEELKRKGVTPVKGESIKVRDDYTYTAPEYLVFDNDDLALRLCAIENEWTFRIGNDGKMKPPAAMHEPIVIGETVYKMGVGGLHSQEKARSITAIEGHTLCDVDVASYYPQMIRNNRYAPSQYDADTFLDTYGGIVERRLAAKAAGDKVTADSLKIVINSSFGKFGNKYSSLFSPELLIHTTITGQLLLLSLIEQMEIHDISVVSANTDGIVCYFDNALESNFKRVVASWEKTTSLVLERTDYKGLYSQSVNSYFAVKPDGTFKGKDAFADMGIGIVDVAPAGHIIGQAVMEYVAGGRHYADTIMECNDIREFVFLRKVAGGAEWDMTNVGGTVRFYIGKEFRLPMTYINNGNNVAGSQNAVIALDLPEEMPDDLWRGWYIREAKKMLTNIGWTE